MLFELQASEAEAQNRQHSNYRTYPIPVIQFREARDSYANASYEYASELLGLSDIKTV